MPSSNPNLSNPSHAVDKKDGYNQVIFQQGKPIIDHDLNDLGQVLRNHADSIVASKSGVFTSTLDYREWAFVPCDVDATSSRNQSNFALTLGRLDTLKGVVDTESFRSSSKDSKIIFDHGKIVTDGNLITTDQGFQNYILKGKVTATGATTTSFQDETKAFDSKHGLLGFDVAEDIDLSGSTNDSLLNTDVERTLGIGRIRIKESAARVRFTTGSNLGEEQVISAFTPTGEITVTSAFSNAPSVDDEYVILPANTLSEFVSDFNGEVEGSDANAKTDSDRRVDSIGSLIVYVQVFDNLVSADEDSDIQSSLLGQETTWRNELRWCIRIARFNGSLNGDVVSSTTYGDLKSDHLYQYVLDSSRAVLSHHASIDKDNFSDQTINNREYLQTHYWKLLGTAVNTYSQSKIGKDIGPFSSTGVSPSQILRSVENDKIIWVAFKALLLRALNSGFTNNFNDVQVLYRFSGPQLDDSSDTDTLSNVIYPGYQTASGQKNFIEAGSSANRPAPGSPYGEVYAPPNSFYSIPRVFHNAADLSSENMRSRILYGYGSDYIYDETLGPIAFSSQSEHLSFIDQMLLGMTGLGAWLGTSNDGNWLAGPVGHTWGTDATLSQSGYGIGAIKMVNALGRDTSPSGVDVEGGISSTGSYKTRFEVNGSHTINWDDPDRGWSVYKEREALDNGTDETTLTTRGWSEGIAQAYEFQQGLNFRKLAIKTYSHKSMDLFTISERPPRKYGHINFFSAPSFSYRKENSNVFFQIPQNIVESITTTSHKYAIGSSYVPELNLRTETDLLISSTSNVPALISTNVDAYGSNTSITPSVVSWDNMDAASSSEHRSLTAYYGPWGRFSVDRVVDSGSTEATDLGGMTDLWANRCTAMRLRYHIGDFYPGTSDSRGVPRNLLVDSLQLFVKLEPLNLTHWMTMPKHQHSVLANSFSMASGIEALLNISHGIGDTQKLITTSGSNTYPLTQAKSPVKTFGLESNTTLDTRVTFTEGELDPTDLPFGHEHQPFIHWYHPAMDKIRSSTFNPSGTAFSFRPYEKWGRRSVIVPALVPSNFFDSNYSPTSNAHPTADAWFIANTFTGDADSDGYQDLDAIQSSLRVPILSYDLTSDNTGYTTALGENDDNGFSTINDVALDVANRANNPLNVTESRRGIDSSLFPYPAHASTDKFPEVEISGSISTDTGSITTKQNRIAFPTSGIQEQSYSGTSPFAVSAQALEPGPRPVFLPAARSYGFINDIEYAPSVGFHPVLRSSAESDWNDVSSAESVGYPWDERTYGYLRTIAAAGETANFSNYEGYNRIETAWGVPVMRAAIRTRTVAAIVELVRTSFETGLADTTLSSDYDFTMPSSTYNLINRDPLSVPSMGPDHNVDTLFVGDYGTSIAGFSNRSAFAHALNLGMGAVTQYNLVPNGDSSTTTKYRDSFDVAVDGNETMPLLYTFATIQGMGLQQKLLLNCSLRVLHHRPGGPSSGSSNVKSLTEVFICNDRDSVYDSNRNGPVALPSSISGNPDKKPFLHVASMHPTAAGTSSSTTTNSSRNPNYDSLRHLGPMICDTIGGNADYQSALTTEDFANTQVNTSAMGDTFNVDPFDYHYNEANMGVPANNPLKQSTISFQNSGVEIQLLQELDLMHDSTGAASRGLDQYLGSGASTTIQDLIPTSNEMTLPGDHEIVFVLYPGYYGAKMYDDSDLVNADLMPSIAGCHITASIEVNRPSERASSSLSLNRHYGETTEDGNQINTYPISSTNIKNGTP